MPYVIKDLEILSTANIKTLKGHKHGYVTSVLHLAPNTVSGYNVCPSASPGCIASCLFTSGHAAVYPMINKARIRKTKFFMEDRKEFMRMLCRDIDLVIRRSRNRGLIPAFRLNATSDVRWENIKTHDGYDSIMAKYPDVQFYDYTKIPLRSVETVNPNYYLTFSRSETNEVAAKRELSKGRNVAVVFEDVIPDTYWGYYTIDGTENDLRFLDPTNVIVGLLQKGDAKKDRTGFVDRDGYLPL